MIRRVPVFLLVVCAARVAFAQAVPRAGAIPPSPKGVQSRVVPFTMEARLADPATRRSAIGELIAEGRGGASRAAALISSNDPNVRSAALSVIAATRAVEQAPIAERVLANDANDSVRAQAADALGALGSSASVAALVRCARSDPNADVRARAVAALGGIESPAVVAPIRHFIARGSDTEFEMAALAAARRHLLEAESDLLSVATHHDRSDHARGAAIASLAALQSASARTAIVQLTRDASPVVRFNAVGAIEELHDATAAGELQRVLDDGGEENYVRIRAAAALAGINTKESLGALRSMGEGANELMAMHAIVALSQADAARARTLAAALRDRAHDPFVIATADRIVRGEALPWGQR